MKSVEAEMGKIALARLFEDEDLVEAITQAAEKGRIKAGFFVLIGTLKKAKMGFFHKGRYQPIDMAEPLEIVSCMGNLSIKEGEPHVHAHIAVSNLKGEVFGGHVLPGCVVSATGELVLIEAVDGSYKESWMIKPNYICGRWVGNILKWNPSVFPVLLAVKSVCAAIF